MELFVNLLWGYHVLGLILLTGMRFTISGGFLQVRDFFKWLKFSLFPPKQKDSEVSPFGALSAALAGSIGTGNIVGVAAAISVGGAGSIFWMWVSSFFGMMTVFAEVVLAVRFKGRYAGAFGYIERLGKVLPFIYGTGCLLSSLTMGNMAQCNAVAEGMREFGVPQWISGAVLCVFLFLLTKRGIKGVTKLTEKLVPIMALIFFGISALCLVKCRSNIPAAFREIMEGAFTLRAGIGGGIYAAVKTGISRGVFSNEAGLGTSSMAFSKVEGRSPRELGYMGIFQVFADTIVMCMVTALCILTATKERSGEYLVLTAFENVLGDAGRQTITVCMILFAFATASAACYYGQVGMDYITRGKGNFLFPYLFGACAFIGSIMDIGIILNFCDAFNGLMAIPNLLALAYFAPEVIELCRSKGEGDPPEYSVAHGNKGNRRFFAGFDV